MNHRDQRVQIAKAIALDYVDRGELRNAVAAMSAAMRKIDGRGIEYMSILGLLLADEGDEPQVRKFINGFQ
jgi:hypothetical protein